MSYLIRSVVARILPIVLMLGFGVDWLIPEHQRLIDTYRSHPVAALLARDVMPMAEVPATPEKEVFEHVCGGSFPGWIRRRMDVGVCLQDSTVGTVAWTAVAKRWLAILTEQIRVLAHIQSTDATSNPASAVSQPRVTTDQLQQWRSQASQLDWKLTQAKEPEALRLAALEIGLAASGYRIVEYFDGKRQTYRQSIRRDANSPDAALTRAEDARWKAAELPIFLAAWPKSWLFAASAVLIIALLLGMPGRMLMALATIECLVALGAMALADFSLFGLSSRRYLILRQFVDPGLASFTFNLSGERYYWWQGHTLLILGMVFSKVLAAYTPWFDRYVNGLFSPADTTHILGCFVLTGLLVVSALALPGGASRAEAIMAACLIGSAWYLAVYGRLIGAGLFDTNQMLSTAKVLLYGSLILGMAALTLSNDLGHVLLLLSAFLLLSILVPQPTLLAIAFGILSLGTIAYLLVGDGNVFSAPELSVERYQERLALWDAPHASGPSDIARLGWFMMQSGAQGWAIGHVPWQGVATPPGFADPAGIPAQTPSDYALAMLAGLWGLPGAIFLGLVATGVLVYAMRHAIRHIYVTPYPILGWLAAFSGMGCFIEAVRGVLSMGGTLSAVPMTGVPIGLLAYAPTALLFQMFFLGLALGLPDPRNDSRE